MRLGILPSTGKSGLPRKHAYAHLHRLPKPVTHLRMTIASKILKLRKRLGLTQLQFGERVGVDQSTISKWEHGTQAPEFEAARSLASLANVSTDEFLGIDSQDLHPRARPVEEVPILGKVAGGIWRLAEDDTPSEPEMAPIMKLNGYENVPKFALEVEGTSMDKDYPPGSIVICVQKYLDRATLPGDHVIVCRHRNDGRIETTIKEIRIHPDGSAWLWPNSNDPNYQAPIQYRADIDAENGESVEIHARVIWYTRSAPNL